jgi:hypothetical protein
MIRRIDIRPKYDYKHAQELRKLILLVGNTYLDYLYRLIPPVRIEDRFFISGYFLVKKNENKLVLSNGRYVVVKSFDYIRYEEENYYENKVHLLDEFLVILLTFNADYNWGIEDELKKAYSLTINNKFAWKGRTFETVEPIQLQGKSFFIRIEYEYSNKDGLMYMLALLFDGEKLLHKERFGTISPTHSSLDYFFFIIIKLKGNTIYLSEKDSNINILSFRINFRSEEVERVTLNLEDKSGFLITPLK